MSNLSISLLGAPRIEQDGFPMTVDTRKAIALVAFLAVTGKAHRRDRLAELLWGGDLSHGRAALRRTLSALRKALHGDWLLIDKGEVGLQRRPGFWLDVEVFWQRLAVHQAHNHESGAVCPLCLPLLQEAVSLYRDTFLANFSLSDAVSFEQWQLIEATNFQQQQAAALQTLVRYYAQTGEYETAVSFAHRWLQLDPTQEPAHQWLMKLYTWQDQPEKALHQYQDCLRLLEQVLEIAPQPETTALFKQIKNSHLPTKPTSQHAPTGQQSTPVLTSLVDGAPRHNLPLQLTPLIGRETELKEVAARLHNPRCRLLTIVGMGGVGKTSLALEFARQQAIRFSDGAAYISLASVSSLEYLLAAMADALQFSFAGANARRQLLNYLREKELFLVLDNFEHLLDEAELLIDILQQAPLVKILVTSRTCLNFRSEWLYEVSGLTYPGQLDESMAQFGAVQLFLYHANRVKPQFTLTPAEATAVLRICHLVAGVPLGLELAAALLSSFSGAEIAAGIEKNLDFLSTTMRDMPLQHRTLRAVFAHSWMLLTAEEQAVLQQVAIFQGGFNQDAALTVTTTSPQLLANLVNKSLLHQSGDGRYSMHNLIQQYALEKLSAHPAQVETTSARHSRYYLLFLQQQAESLKTARQGHALTTIRKEIDNIHAAWNWAARNKAADLNLVLDGLHLFYDFCSWYHEGKKVFTETTRLLSEAGADAAMLARLQARQAVFYHRLSMYKEAKELLLACLSTFAQLHLPLDIMFCLNHLGTALFYLGEYEQAKEYLHESLVIGQHAEDEWHLAYCYNSLGNVYRVLGNCEAGQGWLRKALTLRREIGDKRGIAVTLNNLGNDAEVSGQYEEARQLFQESLSLKQEIGDRKGAGLSMLNLGYALWRLGHETQAARLLADSFTVLKEVGELAGAALALTNQGNVNYGAGRLAEANYFYSESLRISQTTSDRRGIVFSLNDLGKVSLAQSHDAEAEAYFRQALTLATEMKSIAQMLESLAGIAALFKKCGEYEEAFGLFLIIRQHPALDGETEESTRFLYGEMETLLSPVAVQLARQRWLNKSIFDVACEALHTLSRLHYANKYVVASHPPAYLPHAGYQ